MNKTGFILSAAFVCVGPSTHLDRDLPRWQHHAANVTITRDDCGIAQVRGKTDADVAEFSA